MLNCSGCEERGRKIAALFSPRLRKPCRSDVIAEARQWIGTPFHHQGYAKGVGTDCIGLVAGVGLALNIQGAKEWRDDASLHQYGRPPDPRFLLQTCARFLDRIVAPEPADILLMSFEREPMHFAIMVEPSRVVHALYGMGSVVEHRIDSGWHSRIRGAYSYRGLE